MSKYFSRAPLFVELSQKRLDQTDGRIFVGEDPDHPFPSSGLFIQSFLRVRVSEPDPILPGEGQNLERSLKSFLETIHRLGSLLLKGANDLALDDSGFLFGIGPEQSSQGQCQWRSSGGRRMSQNVPEKVHLASLPSDPLKMSPNRFFEPFVVIGDPHIHSVPVRSCRMSSQEASFHCLPT